MSARSHQSGNAIVFLLLAIALFAALAYTFMRSGQNSVSQMNPQQARLAASEILSYANSLSKTVDRLRQRGCSEKQLSFEASGNSGYANASAPGDFSCHVYNAAGGNMTWQSFTNYNATTTVSSLQNILGSASAITDLSLYVLGVSDSVCRAFNASVNIESSVIPTDSSPMGISTPFTGTFFPTGNPPNNDDPRTSNAIAGCVYLTHASFQKNLIYYTLLSR